MKRIGLLAVACSLLVPLTLGTTAEPAAAQSGHTFTPLAPTAGPSAGPASGDSLSATGDDLSFTDLTSSYEGDSARYRIPALTALDNGDILAIYDSRPSMADLPAHIKVMMQRSTDGGTTWSAPETIHSGKAPAGFGDPSVIVDRESGKIFVFYAASINAGFASSATGNDPDDPNILHPDYSVSQDGGHTWKHVRLTDQIKESDWGGMFASSGEGIQLRTGPHAGRLIQQYTVRYQGQNWAMSAYSDDHGETWEHSELVGPGADENKTVELADGQIMLNTRAAPYRRVALSDDGGQTYTDFKADPELVDPSNNGSIIRAYPDAEPNDPKANILLFSNTEDSGIRRNLTIKMSCDNGQSWPVRKVIEPGSAGYSTLTALPGQDGTLGGSYGLLMERNGYTNISYASFDLDWLAPACAPLSATTSSPLVPGSSGQVQVTVENQGQTDLPAGTVELPQWQAEAEVDAIPAGGSVNVDLPVSVPVETAPGTEEARITYVSGGHSSTTLAKLPIAQGATIVSADGPWQLDPTDSSWAEVDLSNQLDKVADLETGRIAVTFATTETPAVGVLMAASDSSSRTKDLILSLNGGKPYLEVRRSAGDYPAKITSGTSVADGKQHTLEVVTDASGTRLLLDGTQIGSSPAAFFSSVSDLDALQLGAYSSSEGQLWKFSGTISGFSVDGAATAHPSLSVAPVLDAIYVGDGDAYLGDQISPWVRVTNTGNVSVDSIKLSGMDGISACNRSEALAPRDSFICRSVRHTITAADLSAGQWAATVKASAQAEGDKTVTATGDLSPVDLTAVGTPTTGASVWIPSGDYASSTLARIPRSGTYEDMLADSATLRLQSAAGAHASGQLAVSAFEKINGLGAAVSELTSADGASIPAAKTQVRFPGYIPDLVAGGVVADPLEEVDSVDVPAGRNQGIWFTTEVPAGTAAGTYTGTVTVTSDDGQIGQWQVSIDVADAQLRSPQQRPFVLDMWFHPDAIADELGLTPFSDEHFAAMKPYLQDLADHGQRVVDAAIVENPWLIQDGDKWVPQTASDYHSTVEWKWDGQSFDFDFTNFDKLVELSESVGISDSIHAFSMLQFRDREILTYTDTRTDKQVQEVVERGGDRYKQAWGAFLGAFEAHLKDKGWFEKTRLSFDERPKAIMDQAFAVIHEVAPDWDGKTALAANSLQEADIADYISFNYSFLPSVPDSLISDRIAQGKPTLFYTFYDPVTPNTVTASPLVSTRSLGWIVRQRGLDGYLRWTYNSWPHDVYNHPSNRYGQGDEYIVYPSSKGPVSSLRWENFTAGQEDAEILALADEAGGHPGAVAKDSLATVDPDAAGTPKAWSAMVRSRADVLDALAAADGAQVSSSMAENEVGRGGDAAMTINVKAGAEDLHGLTLEFDSGVDVGADPIDVAAGETGSWNVNVPIPDSARNLLVISGQVRDSAGDIVGQFTEAPLVGELVSATGELTATRSSSPDGKQPAVVEVPLRNRSAQDVDVSVSVTGSEHWQPTKKTITLPAGFDGTKKIDLNPVDADGWDTVEVTLSVGETALVTGSFDLVSPGIHVSDLEWTQATNGWGQVHRDASVGDTADGPGNQLSIGGRTYSKGVGVHANSEVVFDVPDTCTRFVSDYGIDDEISGGSVVFEVLNGSEKLWSSELVTAASGAQHVDVDIEGVSQLTLKVTDGGNGNGQDHGDWAGAYLRCASTDSGSEGDSQAEANASDASDSDANASSEAEGDSTSEADADGTEADANGSESSDGSDGADADGTEADSNGSENSDGSDGTEDADASDSADAGSDTADADGASATADAEGTGASANASSDADSTAGANGKASAAADNSSSAANNAEAGADHADRETGQAQAGSQSNGAASAEAGPSSANARSDHHGSQATAASEARAAAASTADATGTNTTGTETTDAADTGTAQGEGMPTTGATGTGLIAVTALFVLGAGILVRLRFRAAASAGHR